MSTPYFLIGGSSVLLGIVNLLVGQEPNLILGALLIVLGIGVVVKPLLTDTEDVDYDAPMPAELPGRLCGRCGKMTSLDQATCTHCGAALTD